MSLAKESAPSQKEIKSTENSEELSNQATDSDDSLESPNNIVEIDISNLDIVPSSVNCHANYKNYLSYIFPSIAALTKLDYTKSLESLKKSLDSSLKSQLKDLSLNHKKLLLLDLDETLIHSLNEFECPINTMTLYSNIIIDPLNGQQIMNYFYIRPNAINFLNSIKNDFNVGIFTSSLKEYADPILDILDPNKEIFKFRLYRNSTVNVMDVVSIKDLSIFEGIYDLKDVILVDNSLYSFANQLNNGVLITSFIDESTDDELVNAFNYLYSYLKDAEDIRIINENIFGFEKLLNYYIKDKN